MISQIALKMIGPMPAVAYGGMFTLLLLLITGYFGSQVLKGNAKISVKAHIYLARTAIVLGIIHAFVGLAIFLKY